MITYLVKLTLSYIFITRQKEQALVVQLFVK